MLDPNLCLVKQHRDVLWYTHRRHNEYQKKKNEIKEITRPTWNGVKMFFFFFKIVDFYFLLGRIDYRVRHTVLLEGHAPTMTSYINVGIHDLMVLFCFLYKCVFFLEKFNDRVKTQLPFKPPNFLSLLFFFI